MPDDADAGVISCTGLIGSGSGVTPMVTSSPRGTMPPTVAAIAFELPAVARTTVAPPKSFSASAGSLAVESM